MIGNNCCSKCLDGVQCHNLAQHFRKWHVDTLAEARSTLPASQENKDRSPTSLTFEPSSSCFASSACRLRRIEEVDLRFLPTYMVSYFPEIDKDQRRTVVAASVMAAKNAAQTCVNTVTTFSSVESIVNLSVAVILRWPTNEYNKIFPSWPKNQRMVLFQPSARQSLCYAWVTSSLPRLVINVALVILSDCY